MAVFSNQATLTYNGITTASNIAYGEILEVLSATKTAIEPNYTPDGTVTYVVTLRNTGTAPLTGLTVSDNLGGYVFGTNTVYPLAYVENTAALFSNGTPQPAPAVTAGPPLVFTDITVPAGGDTVLVYQARTTAFAPPTEGGTVVNTVTVTGNALAAPVTAEETIGAATGATLDITKSISPTQVVDNDRVTYTFVIRNSGNEAVVSTDNTVITDQFDPVLSALTVTFDGAVWSEGTQYTYNPTTGLFTSTAGAITVPAATYVQDPVTGEYTTTPGTATLTVTGTI